MHDEGLQPEKPVLQSWASLITALRPETVAGLEEAEGGAERLHWRA
jgi:hypothetical protein